MKGYKVFNKDWTCRGFQFEVGKTYKEDKEPIPREQGFHYCKNLVDCFNHYTFDPENKVAEVEAIGEIATDNQEKHCTNKIKIIRELTWDEVLTLCNTGYGNTGDWNTGNGNTGNKNTGDKNTGYGNTGDKNTGYGNTGNKNTGDKNTGYGNTGDWNTGYGNTGYWNAGNWNAGNGNTGNGNTGYGNAGDKNTGDGNLSNNNSGCFNTEEHTINIFDCETNLTLSQWRKTEAYDILCKVPPLTQWIFKENMTEQEKEKYPNYKTTDGYLKENTLYECCAEWWEQLSTNEKTIIKQIPNFDSGKFKLITGINVEKGE